MDNKRSSSLAIATVLSIYLCFIPLEVECSRNQFRPINRGPPFPQQQMGPNPQQQQMGPQPLHQAGPQGIPPPQWSNQHQQPQHVQAKLANNNWVPKPLRPSANENPFRPEQPPPISETNTFDKSPLKNFQSFNEVPVDEIKKSPEATRADEQILDAVDKLSEEIVEAVVERLEEDEALAIELEREGFDPNAPSAAVKISTTNSILTLILAICAYLIKEY